ncbi:helix-turn-helix transcriptional regulator [Domibacillus sp. DTU_2020_1001157_1_SI_ALB_TIR_016]|uniref:helix-turn-helix domain-containing protein n=1 Tax=Domibacillus sp. DTU_2020_1001157_1_SI_ALB_TIR_016 TaxID=3077789 RepID=UPI0028E95F7E|nr:helix-turn-helix transcriptional regulator [Domibacillus sp. DTU_2020_1001157_1_SI_ALB_TIR_016]WNS81227.1 helix-turn-helix transcriptional regulator [Domibacillus sp. DTU_2020_1001157_1_SI_ALB_TIR_016]
MIGVRIKELRLRKKLTLDELAQKAFVSKAYLSVLETQKESDPPISVINKLAQALDIKMEELLEESKQPEMGAEEFLRIRRLLQQRKGGRL